MPNIFLKRLLAMSIEAARSGSTGKHGDTVVYYSPLKVRRIQPVSPHNLTRYILDSCASAVDIRRLQQKQMDTGPNGRLLHS